MTSIAQILEAPTEQVPLYEKAAFLHSVGFRPCEIARLLYPDYLEAPRRATHRVLSLLHAYRLRQFGTDGFNTDGFDTDVKPARNQVLFTAPVGDGTASVRARKRGLKGLDRLKIEYEQLLYEVFNVALAECQDHEAKRKAWEAVKRMHEQVFMYVKPPWYVHKISRLREEGRTYVLTVLGAALRGWPPWVRGVGLAERRLNVLMKMSAP